MAITKAGPSPVSQGSCSERNEPITQALSQSWLLLPALCNWTLITYCCVSPLNRPQEPWEDWNSHTLHFLSSQLKPPWLWLLPCVDYTFALSFYFIFFSRELLLKASNCRSVEMVCLEVLQSSLTQTPNYNPGKYMAVALLHHCPPTSKPAQIVRDTSAFLVALMGPKPMPTSFQRPYQTTSLIPVTANACLCFCKFVSVQLWKTLLCITRCLAGGHRTVKEQWDFWGTS